MLKLKNSLKALSKDDIKTILVLLESLTFKNITQPYLKKSKNNFKKIVHLLQKRVNSEHSLTLKPINNLCDTLNIKYHQFTHLTIDEIDRFFLSSIERHSKNNKNPYCEDLFYSIIESISLKNLISIDMTPAEKAHGIAINTYQTLLKNLKDLLNSLSKDDLKIIENKLDVFFSDISKKEKLLFKEITQLELLTGFSLLDFLMKENDFEKNLLLTKNEVIPEIIIKTVNSIIEALTLKNVKFTQINSLPWTFILFKGSQHVFWLLKISPSQLLKGSEQLTNTVFSIIIFLAGNKLSHGYLPRMTDLPSYQFTEKEIYVYEKKHFQFKKINHQLSEVNKKIETLEIEFLKKTQLSKDLVQKIDEFEDIVSTDQSQLSNKKLELQRLEKKYLIMTHKHNQLKSKISPNLRVRNKIESLNKSSQVLTKKKTVLKKEISSIIYFINKRKSDIKVLTLKLESISTEISKIRINVELFKNQKNKYQLKSSKLIGDNKIFYSFYWKEHFEKFKISNQIYKFLLMYTHESLLAIERILVELHNTENPKCVGFEDTHKTNTFYIKVKNNNNKTICEITYEVSPTNQIFIKKLQ